MPSVKDIMTKDVVSIDLNNSVFEAAELMSSSQLGCLVIMDGKLPVGIVTERYSKKSLREKIGWRNQSFGNYVKISHNH